MQQHTFIPGNVMPPEGESVIDPGNNQLTHQLVLNNIAERRRHAEEYNARAAEAYNKWADRAELNWSLKGVKIVDPMFAPPFKRLLKHETIVTNEGVNAVKITVYVSDAECVCPQREYSAAKTGPTQMALGAVMGSIAPTLPKFCSNCGAKITA
jgi:hypothetical protein